MALKFQKAVGKNCPNVSSDIIALHARLMEIAKIPCYECTGAMDDVILNGILSVQGHFMRNPDGVISVDGRTHEFLKVWSEKPVRSGAQLPGRLTEAWSLVNPLLPDGSACTSGYRSPQDQRRILHNFFLQEYRVAIIKKYGAAAYDAACKNLTQNEQQVLDMVRGVGQQIATPGKSRHQQGKAVDVGGPSLIDQKQVDVIKLVAHAHPNLFSTTILKERNGCVHFEIH